MARLEAEPAAAAHTRGDADDLITVQQAAYHPSAGKLTRYVGYSRDVTPEFCFRELARGDKLSQIRATMNMVAEGVYTTRSVRDKALKMDLDMPITAEVYRMLYEDKDPRAAVHDLMRRQPTSEE